MIVNSLNNSCTKNYWNGTTNVKIIVEGLVIYRGYYFAHSVDLCSVMRCELDIRRHLGMIAHVMRDHTVLRAIHMFNGKKLNLQMT